MGKVIYVAKLAKEKKPKRYVVERQASALGTDVYMRWCATNFKLRAIWAAWSMGGGTMEFRVVDTREEPNA